MLGMLKWYDEMDFVTQDRYYPAPGRIQFEKSSNQLLLAGRVKDLHKKEKLFDKERLTCK